MKISHRFILCIGIMFSGYLATVAVSYVLGTTAQELLTTNVQTVLPAALENKKAIIAMEAQRNAFESLYLYGNINYINDSKKARKTVENALKTILNLPDLTEDEQNRYKTFLKDYSSWSNDAEAIYSVKYIDLHKPDETFDKEEQLTDEYQRLHDAIDDLVGYFTNRLIGENATTIHMIDNQLRWSVILFLVAVVITAIVFRVIVKKIVHPLLELTATADRIRMGNIHEKARISGKDEIGFLGAAFNNMTDKLRNTLNDLREEIKARERLMAILTETSDLVAMVTPDKKIEYLNNAGRKMVGMGLTADLEAIYLTDIFPQWAYKTVETQGIKSAMANGVWEGDTALISMDNREIPVSQVIICHKSGINELEYISTIIRDMSERKRVEAEIRKLNAELEERVAQRTEQLSASNRELEAFAYSVSHDLRAPLRAIDGFSLAVMEDYTDKLDDTGVDYLNRLRTASQRMGTLIDDILKLSRLSRSEMTISNVDLSDIAQSIAHELKERDPDRKVDVIVKPSPPARGDSHLIKIALENIMGNAWKFTSKTPHARIVFGSEEIEGETAYYVRDNGAGFDMQYAEKLFGAFQRLHTDQEFPGSGVGLATVQRVINRHRGRVWAESSTDNGTVFYFTLGAYPLDV